MKSQPQPSGPRQKRWSIVLFLNEQPSDFSARTDFNELGSTGVHVFPPSCENVSARPCLRTIIHSDPSLRSTIIGSSGPRAAGGTTLAVPRSWNVLPWSVEA
jgi:hypothetical protein